MTNEEMSGSEDVLELLALCCWREARGEGEDGMRAVGHVIINRSKVTPYTRYAQPIFQVIMERGQFTSMSNPHDPEYRLHPAFNDRQYAFCLSIGPALIADTDKDNTNGALYYANLKELPPGAWFIREFAGDTPWVHLDIAGTAWNDDAKAWLAKGPTGVALRTLVHLAMSY